MTDNNLNATCSICGQKYKLCLSCKNEKKFKPWRTVTDSIEHYKVYMAIHGYTVTKDKASAKVELQNCNLSDIDSFKPEIQNVIKKIMSELVPVKAKPVSRTKKNNAVMETEQKSNEENETVPETESKE